jgi:uncharacterized protein YlxP (DUF503 family)
MHVGILQLDLSIPGALTLKDKRRIVLSLKDRIANGHNVSVAEVDRLDEYQRSIMGIAMVSNDKRYVEGGLSRIVDMVRMAPDVTLLDYQVDFA